MSSKQFLSVICTRRKNIISKKEISHKCSGYYHIISKHICSLGIFCDHKLFHMKAPLIQHEKGSIL